jgi:hypothetical protein
MKILSTRNIAILALVVSVLNFVLNSSNFVEAGIQQGTKNSINLRDNKTGDNVFINPKGIWFQDKNNKLRMFIGYSQKGFPRISFIGKNGKRLIYLGASKEGSSLELSNSKGVPGIDLSVRQKSRFLSFYADDGYRIYLRNSDLSNNSMIEMRPKNTIIFPVPPRSLKKKKR